MDLEANDDQLQLLTALDRLVQPFESAVLPAGYGIPGDAIEEQLREAGFLDLVASGGGTLDAAMMIARIARLPHAVEIGASALVAPLVCGRGSDGPVSLATGRPGQAVRFLDRAAVLLFDDGDAVYSVAARDLERTPCDSIFGYSYAVAGCYRGPAAERLEVSPMRFHTLWRTALAAEIAGTAEAALDHVTAYVKVRQQFGKPLGTFQAIQHRLSECAVIVHSMRILSFKAAATLDPQDAAMAVAFAQNGLRQITYDVQQFHGAIGLTLEFPIHYWTQRLRALAGELGGACANAEACPA